MVRALLLGALSLASARRRELQEHDLHYGLEGFNGRYNTRAPGLFSSEEHFHRRLFQHEEATPEDRLQTFLVNLEPGCGSSPKGGPPAIWSLCAIGRGENLAWDGNRWGATL